MEKKVKYIIVISVIAVVFGTVFMMPSALAIEDTIEEETTGGPVTRRVKRFWLLIQILKKGVPTELEATILALDGQILVVEIDDRVVNINMPRKWVYNGDTSSFAGLFDGEPFAVGGIVTLRTLMVQMVQDTHTVTAYFAYEIADGETATAILPFNIQV